MTEIAITGGIGSGKTTVAKLLVDKGVVLVDADQIVRDLQKPGGKVFNRIVEIYGNEILLDDGELDRQKIAEIVFNDENELSKLNDIVHPAVGEEMGIRRKEAIKQGNVVLVDIPLMVTPEGELGRNEYKLFDEGEMSLKDKIPFAIAYSNRVGYYESRSPLYDIAELNLKHYQIQSDLDNILHISSILKMFYKFFKTIVAKIVPKSFYKIKTHLINYNPNN